MTIPNREALEAELAQLNTLLAGGVSRVTSKDRSLERDLGEVRRRRDEIRAELQLATPTRMVRRVYLRAC